MSDAKISLGANSSGRNSYIRYYKNGDGSNPQVTFENDDDNDYFKIKKRIAGSDTEVMRIDEDGKVSFLKNVAFQGGSTIISTTTTQIEDQQLEIGIIDSIEIASVASNGDGTETFTVTSARTSGSNVFTVGDYVYIQNAKDSSGNYIAEYQAALPVTASNTSTFTVTVSPSATIDTTNYPPVASKLTTLTDNTGLQILAVDGSGNIVRGSLKYNNDTDKRLFVENENGDIYVKSIATKDTKLIGGQILLESIDDTASAISLTTNNGTSETITVTNTQGTDNGAIALTSTAGGITLKVADEKELTMGNAAGDAYFKVAASATAGNEDVRIVNTNGTDEAAIAITATAGGIDIDAAAGKDVNIAGGQLTLTSKTNEADAISLTTNNGSSETITVTNTQGTDNGAIALTSTAGGITLKVADEKDLTMGNAAGDAYFKVAASATAGNEDVRIVNTNGTDEAAIAITATAGGVDIDAAAGKDVNIAGGQLTLTSKTDEANAISLTTNVGTAETITVTNTQGTDNGAIALTSTAGGITMKVADEKELTMGNAAGDAYFKVAASATAGNEDVRIVNTNGTDEAAIAITASAGGVDIDAAAGKDVNIAGGQIAISSKTNEANAISLTTNVGSGETITVTNTQGTNDAAISITSTAGGIKINSKTKAELNTTNDSSSINIGSNDIDAPINIGTDGVRTVTIGKDIANAVVAIEAPTLTAKGEFSSSSDRTLKTNIKPLEESAANLAKIQGVEFNWKKDPEGNKQFGFIAQEVQQIFPNLVGKSNDDTLTVNYIGFIGVLVEGFKQQQKQIEELQKQVADLSK